MSWIRGYYRLCLSGLTLGLGGSLIILTSWMPLQIRGFRMPFWIVMFIAGALLKCLNVKVCCPKRETFRHHQGYVFPNHVSYVEIVVLLSVSPVRFLAKAEVRSWPLIGLMARSIGRVFVKRKDKESRAEAKVALAEVEAFPPVVLFPEGKRGPGDELLPFRYGAFEIVIQGGQSFLPCVVVYDPLEVAIWQRGELFIKALWRLATYPAAVTSSLIACEAVLAAPDSDPAQLSMETRASMTTLIEKRHTGTVREQP
jgi:1-acyl-sn-glycerol-3-phosphate acyltransferase